jgi:hypothetical protein
MTDSLMCRVGLQREMRESPLDDALQNADRRPSDERNLRAARGAMLSCVMAVPQELSLTKANRHDPIANCGLIGNSA